MKIKKFPPDRTLATAIAILGFTVALGWAVGNESMVRVVPGSVAMGLNTALMFIAAAVCLAQPNGFNQHSKLGITQSIFSWLLVILPSLILFEHWQDVSLGIDWTALHATVKDGNPRPGRTAPNTCLAFLLAGVVFLMAPHARFHKSISRLIAVLTYTLLALGLTAFIGYSLKLEVLYQIASYNRMAAATAAGITLIGTTLWLRLHQSLWQGTSPDSADKRIAKVAAIVLTLFALIAGLTGFAVLKQGFEETISAALLRSTKNSATAFSTTIGYGLATASSINSRPGLKKNLLKLHDNPGDAEALRSVNEVGNSILSAEITGIQFLSSSGEPLAVAGKIVEPKAEMAVPLQVLGQKAGLLWQDDFVFWTESQVLSDGREIAKIIVEQRMPALTAMLRDLKGENSSTDILICGRSRDDAVCFPSRFYKAKLHIPMFKDGKPYLAISRALLDQTGTVTVKDIRGIQVLAGYAPIGKLGLGMVLKTDNIELYLPIRDRLNLLAGLLIVLVAAGTFILHTQVRPLARQVVKDQRRMRVIIDSSHEAFVEINESGLITDWNLEAERTFGWTRQEALGRNIAETIIPSSMRQGHHNGMTEFRKSGKGAVLGKRVELPALHRSGKEFLVEVTISAIQSETGHSFAAFLHDITDRKEAQLSLIESQHRFNTFMDHSPAVVFMKDENGHMIYANKSFEEAFAFQEADWKNKADADLWPEEVASHLRQNDLDIFASNKSSTVEEDVPTAQGNRTWISHKFPLRSASGHRLIGGIAIDITERKQMEDDLFKEKESLRVTLSSIGDAVITTDTAGNVTYLNPVAEQMTGWKNSDAKGLPLPDVFHIVNENTGEIAPNPVEHVLLNEQAVGLAEFTLLVARGGSRHPIEDSAAPIRDRNNNIIGVVLVFHDVSHAREMAAEMTHQATHDALTGLINRREFERRVELALQTGKQGGTQHSLLYLDLDQFKIVNDTCGHVAGDELLRQLSTLLGEKLRQSDTLARLGGDEFGVLLESCGTEPALRIADLLRQTVSDFHFVWLDKVFSIGVSIGLVTFANGGITLADIMRMADAACYVSKDSGRNRVHVYAEQDQKLIQRHGEMGWIGRIQKALDENRFVLYSQKIQATSSEREDHFELLIRMQDEDGSLIPPMAFIPAAERYGLMPTIDRWVIKTAFSHYSARRSRGDSPDKYAINLSGTSIGDDHILAFIQEQCAKHVIPAGHIFFEITETAAIANLNQAVILIRELKAIGFKFSLDDFGSGMSSFTYLKHLPVDFLKIDGGFVKDMVDDPIDRAMVESIHHIGHVMGIQTIAEFAENDAIVDALKKIGVDFVQGYGVGKPGPLR